MSAWPNDADAGMASSSEAANAALLARGFGVVGDASSVPEYRVLLPTLPTGIAALNSVVLHGDVSARPFRISDFRKPLDDAGVLKGIASLGSFQMNHVWIATMKTVEAKRQLLAKKELLVKGKRCLVMDPNHAEIKVKVHWIPYHVADDVLRAAFEPYGKTEEIIRETWRIEGFEGVESTTRSVRLKLKEGITVDMLPQQLHLFSGNVLVVVPGRAPVCLRCKMSGHIRRDCRIPKCSECFRFGHNKEDCVKNYATAVSGRATEEPVSEVMDAVEAEETAQESAEQEKKETQADTVSSAAETEVSADVEETTQQQVEQAETAVEVEKGATTGKENIAQEEKMDSSVPSAKRSLEKEQPTEKAASSSAPSEQPWKLVTTKRGRYNPAPRIPTEVRRRRESK